MCFTRLQLAGGICLAGVLPVSQAGGFLGLIVVGMGS